MRILLTGSSGLVGTGLIRLLTSEGHEVVRLVRYAAAPSATELFWNPAAGVLEIQKLERFDAVVHLGGDNLAEGRWTARKRARIRDSRVQSTRLLCESLAKVSRPPRVLASASAVGFYGHRPDEVLTEVSRPGSGFLSEVCQDWEKATAPAAETGVRVIRLRFGVILSTNGGALPRMLRPFHLHLGGTLGSGKQFWSWITLKDAVRAVSHVLTTEELSGPVNIVSPQPVTNREFTQALGQALGCSTFLTVPSFAARLAFGRMADELLLSSQRVQPERLQSAGYTFLFPQLADALGDLLG